MATASNSSIQVQNPSAGCGSRQRRASICPSGISRFSTVDRERSVIPSSSSFSSFTSEGGVPAANFSDDAIGGVNGDQHESSENGGCVKKKPAWNKPSGNATMEVGAVMEPESWPSLLELARALPKPSSIDFSKDVSINGPQGMTVGSQEEVTITIAIPTPSPNHTGFISQTSIKLDGDCSSKSSKMVHGSLSQAPSMQSVAAEGLAPNPRKSGFAVGESSRGNTHKDVGQGGGSNEGHELQHPLGSFRRNYSGPLSQGNNSYHNTHGGRRDQERRRHDCNYRTFGSRESNVPQQRVGVRPFIRGAPFIPPSPPPGVVRAFVPPVVYNPDMASHMFYPPWPHPDTFIRVPMVPPPPPYYPMPDPELPSKIVKQIDYYFSIDNLVKDTFLRQKMDGEGWVPITLIAGFNKMVSLTNDIQLIKNALQASNVVEVQGDKLRCKNDWHKWIIPPRARSS